MIILVAFVIFSAVPKLGTGQCGLLMIMSLRPAAWESNAGLNSKLSWVMCALLATLGGFVIASARGVSIYLGDLVMVVLAVALMAAWTR